MGGIIPPLLLCTVKACQVRVYVFTSQTFVMLTVKCFLSFCFVIGDKARNYSYFLTCVLDNSFLYMCCVIHVLQNALCLCLYTLAVF